MNPPNREATVINLASGEPVTQIKQHDGYCNECANSVLIDDHLRLLTCRKCGAILDPFNWASRMAREESYLMRRIFDLKRESQIHSETVEALKAEEQRVKARVRAAKDSLLKGAGI